MVKARVVSFDVEGTIVTPSFSDYVWLEAIPRLYARNRGISFQEAKAFITKEYEKVGMDKPEWYDIAYWFKRFNLENFQSILEDSFHRLAYYPEVKEVLEGLRGDGYRLIIISNSSREFLRFQIKELEDYFDQVFSTTSDFAQTKHHAELYSRIYSLTGVTPQQAVHVGDRLDSDFHPPRKAGAIAYHLDRSGRNRGEYVVRDLVEFREKLNRFDGCR